MNCTGPPRQALGGGKSEPGFGGGLEILGWGQRLFLGMAYAIKNPQQPWMFAEQGPS